MDRLFWSWLARPWARWQDALAFVPETLTVTPQGDTVYSGNRPAGLGRLEISVTPPGYEVPDPATLDAYAAAGVDRVILRPRPDMDASALERFTAETGRTLGLKAV